jgi:NhaP-type Na+/H+ or K+/H+ antiporter
MDPYDVFLVVLGVGILATAVLPRLIRDLPLSLPIVHVLFGLVLYTLVTDLPSPDPLREGATTERVSELVVIISLMAAGLKIDRRIGWRSWQPTWRLLALAMPATIAATALLGWWALGLVASSALLLGAVIAPTDPVLAGEVQVPGPNAGEEDDARITLTAEAGLNDALAFPFTNLAIAVLGGGAWFGGWLLDDVVLKLTSGLVVGYLAGRLLGWIAFRGSPEEKVAHTTEGFVAVGATLLVYGVAELAHGYGFLSVFVAAVVLRDHERDHEYHQVLHESVETVERLGSALLLILIGGAVAVGGLSEIGPVEAGVAVLIVVLVRPVTAWLSLARTSLSSRERLTVSAFGIRGMGSVYYLAHAANEADFDEIDRLWSVVLLVILLSVVVHGTTAARAVEKTVESDGAPTAPR